MLAWIAENVTWSELLFKIKKCFLVRDYRSFFKFAFHMKFTNVKNDVFPYFKEEILLRLWCSENLAHQLMVFTLYCYDISYLLHHCVRGKARQVHMTFVVEILLVARAKKQDIRKDDTVESIAFVNTYLRIHTIDVNIIK